MHPTVLGLPADIEQLLGRGHLLVLHFPIALLLAAFAVELLAKLRRTGKPSPSGLSCALLGTLGAVVAGLTGWLYAEYEPPGRSLEETLFLHRWGGVTVASLATIALLLGAAARAGGRPKATGWYRATLLLVALAVVYVGHLGGEMVHGEGYFDLGGTPSAQAGSVPDPLATGSSAGTPPGASGIVPGTPASGVGAEAGLTPPATAFDFDGLVKPIFEARCSECHGPAKRKGRLRLDTPDDCFMGDPADWLVQPGRPDASELLRLVELPDDDLDRMPGKGPPLTAEQKATLRAWIVAGAPWPGRPSATNGAAGTAARTESNGGSNPGSNAGSTAGGGSLPGGAPAPGTDAPAANDASSAGADSTPTADEPLIPDTAPVTDEQRQLEQAAVSALVAHGALAGPVAVGQRAVEVDFGLHGDAVNDGDLALLAGLEPSLVWLGLQGTAISDDGLASLPEFTALRRLNLSRTAVGDAGLAHLAGLPRLETLNLYGTRVTDAGLESLQGLTALRRLYLWDTQVTAAGVQALRDTLPELVIDVGQGADTIQDDAASDG